MSSRRPWSLSQVTSSWLILSAGWLPPPVCRICTTTVRSFGVVVCFWSFGGCGTSASRPCGVRGVITMKMISSTSSTSIRGVTLISALAPPPPPPTAIAISISPYDCETELLLLRRSARRRLPLDLLRQQTQLIHTRRTEIVDHILDLLIPRARIALHIHRLVELVGEQVLHFCRQ